MGHLLGRIFVGLTSCLILFIAYSSQIFIVWPWYGRELSVQLLNLLLPFNVLVGMILWNYFLCVRTDPGRVPDSWVPDTQSGDGYEVKRLTGGPRYCRTCEKYKPPRAHHCRQCNRCVLRMDHHCPWVNNCVGHYNYGHFIRFLFYVDLACSYHLAMMTHRVFRWMDRQSWDDPTSLELVFMILNYTACIPVILSVGAFSIYHFYCLMGNTTTIEGWEKDKAAHLVRRGKINEIKFPYNLGVKRNIASVLGSNPLLWCCPTVTPGTGLKYQLAAGDACFTQAFDVYYPNLPWPPRDPSHDDTHTFTLPSSPWTYENGSLNPDLQPSSAHLLASTTTVRRREVRTHAPHLALPPYHPDYNESSHIGPDYSVSSSSGSGDESPTNRGSEWGVKVRHGSEGYEVPVIDREELLRHYIQNQSEEPGRYRRYVPESGSGSEGEDEDVPLVRRVEDWRTDVQS